MHMFFKTTNWGAKAMQLVELHNPVFKHRNPRPIPIFPEVIFQVAQRLPVMVKQERSTPTFRTHLILQFARRTLSNSGDDRCRNMNSSGTPFGRILKRRLLTSDANITS